MSSDKERSAKKRDGKPALLPMRRFPEFRGQEAWKQHTLKEVTTALLDGDWIESKDQSQRGYRLIQTGNVGIGEFIAKSGKARFVSDETFKRLRCTEIFPGDCLVSRLPDPVGRSCFIPDIGERMITAVDCAIVRFDKAKIVPYLFVAHSQTDRYFREVAALSSGSTRQRISKENLSEISLALPPLLAEQQKIAECLSSLDELISAQARKVDVLKTCKKGLAQQLFPREGEIQPRLRFSKFIHTGNWGERELGTLIEEFRGKSTVQDEYEVLTSARGGLVRQREYYDNDRITERDNIGFNIIPPGFVTYRSRSDDRQFYFNENRLGITGIVSVYYPVFRATPGSNKFLIELLSAFSSLVGKYSVGTSQTVLSLNQLSRIRLPYPPTENEQHSIADCLSSLDALITVATQKLEAVQRHKRGLMQQLFPCLE